MGMKRSPEAIEKTASANRGRKHSPETCAKKSAALKGRMIFSPEALAKNPATVKGRIHTLEHRLKNSIANKGRKQTDLAKLNMSLGKTRPVKCVETGQVFQSGKAAGDWCVAQGLTSNTRNKTVINYAIRTSTRAYGYHWVEDNAG